jgi:hypothetical protein
MKSVSMSPPLRGSFSAIGDNEVTIQGPPTPSRASGPTPRQGESLLGEGAAALHNLAAEFRVSPERVRQIEAKALETIENAMPGAALLAA